MWKSSVSVAALLCYAGALNAEDTFFDTHLPGIVENIARGAEQGDALGAAEQELTGWTLNFLNSAVDEAEQNILASSNFTHLEFSIGRDALGLKEGGASKTEAMAVYRLRETDNFFIFNQASFVNFDDRNTINLGLGGRHINDNETVIMGLNAFFDYEVGYAHKRSGLGAELITSMLEFRTNKYVRASGTLENKGNNETALEGYDVTLRANLPYFYSSDVYFTRSEWNDGAGYTMRTEELGVSAEIVPNMTITLAHQSQKGQTKESVASVAYSVPIGPNSQSEKRRQDGKWNANLKPIRDKLYKPVQRENRIAKKVEKKAEPIQLGVSASGF
jgi:hypothetical protein